MHAFVGVDELTLQKLNGVIADLLVEFTNVGASAPGGGDAGDSLFSLVRTLPFSESPLGFEWCCAR
jgi:hypothetical protein